MNKPVSRRKLREAELRTLGELSEKPEKTIHWDGFWFFTGSRLRTLRSLTSLGLAEAGEHDLGRYGYRITPLGISALMTGRAG